MLLTVKEFAYGNDNLDEALRKMSDYVDYIDTNNEIIVLKEPYEFKNDYEDYSVPVNFVSYENKQYAKNKILNDIW